MAEYQVSDLENYLRHICNDDRERNAAEQFVLEYGQGFPIGPLPRGVRRGKAKQCYVNAEDAVPDEKLYGYAEGFATKKNEMTPFDHAWCVKLADGTAFDPTLKPEDVYAENFPSGLVGHDFDESFVMA
jgi:hypothetical protein